jgi:hypothetical protein
MPSNCATLTTCRPCRQFATPSSIISPCVRRGVPVAYPAAYRHRGTGPGQLREPPSRS